MLKVMKDFIRRTTDPNLGDPTYSEARQFLSNAGQRLSTAEQMKLTPMATRYVSLFASSPLRSTTPSARLRKMPGCWTITRMRSMNTARP